MMDPADLALELGKPVANGLLSRAVADAAITVATVRGLRDGTMDGNGTLDERLHIYRHILAIAIRNQEARREQTTGAIMRILRPMIATLQPSGAILAEAFNANGDAGFPLSEGEVKAVVATELYWSLQRKPDVRRR